MTVVTGGFGSPAVSERGVSGRGRRDDRLRNRLTSARKLAAAALLAGLQPDVVGSPVTSYVTDGMSRQLNALLDERPTLRAAREHKRETVARVG
jgi:hypothetical protein